MSGERSVFKHQQQGVSLRAYSEQTGIREGQLRYYCTKGQILGARKHPLTKKWWIYPPAKLVLSDAAQFRKPRNKAPEPGNAKSAQRLCRRVVVDVGTRPHGLSAGLSPQYQETLETIAPPLSAKPLLTLNGSTGRSLDEGCNPVLLSDSLFESGGCRLAQRPQGGFIPLPSDAPQAHGFDVSPGVLPSVFAAPEVQETMRSIKKAAGEAHYPVVLSGSQMKLMEQAISDAIDGAIDAMSNEPGGRHEIKPYLDAYNQIYRTLKAAKAAHKTANEDWRGVEL